MKELGIDWLFILAICVVISWVGALVTWAFPSLGTFSPVEFGSYFSGISFAGCIIAWILGWKKDC